MCPIAEKPGRKTETPRRWLRRVQRDEGGVEKELSSDKRERLKALARENRDLRGVLSP